MKEIPSILIIAPSWVGDTMMAQPLFKLLKENPCDIDVVAQAWTYDLLKFMPEIREVLLSPFGHGDLSLRERYQFGKKLKPKNYQRAIVLPNSFKSAIIPWAAEIPQRTGWLGEFRFLLLNDIHKKPERYHRQVDRYLALHQGKLPREIPVPSLLVDQETQDKVLAHFNLTLKKEAPILALCPGAAYGSAKCWPKEYYAAVAKEKRKQGYEIWLFGSVNEAKALNFISEEINNDCQNFAGNPLDQTIALLSLATCIISNDSGLMHIGAALNKPLFALFGPTNKAFTPPLSPFATVLSMDFSCQPCGKRTCPLSHHDCMVKLKPELVLERMAASGL